MGRLNSGARQMAPLLAMGFLVACGGDGGNAPAPVAPTNRAPTFTSAQTVSVAENSSGSFYSPVATDPDGDAVAISLAASGDAAAFSFSNGALSFVRPPNFDQPTDADYDNLYTVTFLAQDAKGASTSLSVTVRVTNQAEGISVSRLTTGLGQDAVIAARTRGAEGLITVSQDGSVREFFNGSADANSAGNVFKQGETGRVLSVAHFNGYGVAMLDIVGLGVVVRTIILQDSQLRYVIEQRIAAPSTQEASGALWIGGDGFLFGALGDPTGNLAQDSGSGYGKYYRVQVDPYCGASISSYCIYAENFGDGVHAPAGGGRYASRSFMLDSGTGQQEEVSYFQQTARPLDFGWPFWEGTLSRATNPPPQVNGPSLTYTIGDGFFQGRGLTGGVHYTGPIGALDDRILLTDRAGKIFSFPAGFLSDTAIHSGNEMENRTADFAPIDGTIERPIAIVRDGGQRLYVLDRDGELYQVKPAS